jgi:hypothetical protein
MVLAPMAEPNHDALQHLAALDQTGAEDAYLFRSSA